jgi:cytochrome bd ubiquinol oxidase subunit II
MGTVVGGIVAGQIPGHPSQASLSAWTTTTSLLTGLLFVSACAYLAASYLIGEAARRDDRRLQAYFTRRAQVAGVVTGALSLATLLALHSSDPTLLHRLTGRALPLVIVAAACGVALLGLLLAGQYRGVRIIAALGVAAVIWGWGVAQYPSLLPGTGITLSNAGAPHATLVALVVLFAAVALIVGPSFVLLFSLQGRRLLEAADGEALPAMAGGTRPAPGPPGGPPPSGRRAPRGRAVILGLVAIGALIRALVRRRNR